MRAVAAATLILRPVVFAENPAAAAADAAHFTDDCRNLATARKAAGFQSLTAALRYAQFYKDKRHYAAKSLFS
jgi:hypothetical protein